MAYSDVKRIEKPVGEAITTANADLIQFVARRPFRVLGFGLGTVSAFTAGTGAVGGVVTLQHSVGGAAFADKATLTLPNANHALGKVWEQSELLRGRAPSAPEDAIAGFDVAVGDVVRIRVTTAQAPGTGGTAGNYVAYLLVAPKGSL